MRVPAQAGDVEAFCELQIALFREDAGVHDAHTDLTWPERESATDFDQLVSSDGSIVLLAKDETQSQGFLVGYVSKASATRQPVLFATLRSL